MSKLVTDLQQFQNYVSTLQGDEKGEAQVFSDRLFKAFGHEGYKEAGATLEFRVKKKGAKGTTFADLMWKPRMLMEMKKREENLNLHYSQAFQYWVNSVPNRPRYVVLCNFDEFWIYDFDKQLDVPVDKVLVSEIHHRYTAFNFMLPVEKAPIFNNDREQVSRQAANQTAKLFQHLVKRQKNPIDREVAQRFVLQLVIAMFAEDIDLMPSGTVTQIARDCLYNGQSSYDLFNQLFSQMNSKKPATGGRFVGVPYFNGGLFAVVQPIELTNLELKIIGGDGTSGDTGIAGKDWSKVNPAIFGTIFQHSMDTLERHQHGRHFTSEADIQRIVGPTIVHPWEQRIDKATTGKQLIALRKELSEFKVLDPACGSGNFLYVAYREMARLDSRIMLALAAISKKDFAGQSKRLCAIRPQQFFGIDNDHFGVELTKVVLLLAKKLSLDAAVETFTAENDEFKGNLELIFSEDEVLPLDNLDKNILHGDALFIDWPEAEAIVGNPPYQSKNKLQEELGPAYLNRLRARHPEVSGLADYCVYWIRLAHDHLKDGERAGLVGTNTIKQNYSRESGLDYILDHGGTITEAISSMIWPGAANLSVSIVNWVKGEESGKKRLYVQEGNKIDSGWRYEDLDRIPSSLSFKLDVTKASEINANSKKGGCFQGQTHGHEGFLLSPSVAKSIISKDTRYGEVVKPYIIADDMIGEKDAKPTRYVIDFSGKSLLEAQSYPVVFNILKAKVLPKREQAAEKERLMNNEALKENPKAKINRHHENFLRRWWQMSYGREEMISAIRPMDRYIACGRTTLRPVFEFISKEINPSDAIQVFPYDDDYSYGILQSTAHWIWFVNRCSTLTERFRYTSNTVWDTFPWPQKPTLPAMKKVADAGRMLRLLRHELRDRHGLSFRELYRSVELPGIHPLKDAIGQLDAAVKSAYGMPKGADYLQFILELNQLVSKNEKKGIVVQGPGLPSSVKDRGSFISNDCIEP
ncbi:DNA methyltransferase [Agrobacterium pusense]|uniref:site-specific DNA-methyltransferase (adenine-specific) n=1 Tax=Agrobacterium pusense TaxID=648995 RepID=U4PXK8_9HYPH|nr:DNA methyltransferase [Agrobacterium pusense]CDI09830.1 DNA modification methyltransferase-related protein [Agrobacterium pusense]